MLLEIFSRYARYVEILKWTTLSLLSYVATALVVDVPGGRSLTTLSFRASFAERLYRHDRCRAWDHHHALLLLLAVVTGGGDERVDSTAHPLLEAPQEASAEIGRIRLDTYLGMGLSNLISLFIIVTTAATLHVHGITDIQTSAQAAEALRPIAGVFTFTVFATGIIGIGLLAVPVLAGSAAYALGEALDWTTGLDRQPLARRHSTAPSRWRRSSAS